MGIKCATAVKNILDRKGCNYQFEKKIGKSSFFLDNQYNELFEECPMYLGIEVGPYYLSVCAMLKEKIQGEEGVPVSKLLSRINKELASNDDFFDVRVEWNIEEGLVYIRLVWPYLKCPDDFELMMVLSIPLILMCTLGKWIIATAHGELSVEEAYEAITNMQEENFNKGFLDEEDI